MTEKNKAIPAPPVVVLSKRPLGGISKPSDAVRTRSNETGNRRIAAGSKGGRRVVAIYARYSSGKQNGRSIDRQIAAATAYMRAKGLTKYVLYADPARGGGSTNARDNLARLRDDCSNGAISHVVVEDFARLSRETHNLVGFCEELNKRGVIFHSVVDGRALTGKAAIEMAKTSKCN